MQDKIEKPKTTPTATEGTSLSFTEKLHQTAWNGLNFATGVVATSAAIMTVQPPMRKILVSLTQTGALPSVNGGMLAIAKTAYSGASAAATGTTIRTAYVTGTKTNKPIAESTLSETVVKEEGFVGEESIGHGNAIGLATAKSIYHKKADIADVMAATAGEMLVTQVSESLSTLRQTPGLLPKDFKWCTPHNVSKLMFNGFAPRYATGMISFAAMLQLEGTVAQQLPIENATTRHTVAGAISGATAAIASNPISMLRDYVVIQSTVNANGQLVTKSTFEVARELLEHVRSNPKPALKAFALNAAKQAPLKAGLSASIFAIVSGMNAFLGDEPLKKVIPERYQPPKPSQAPQTFFASTAKKPANEATPEPVKTPGVQ